MTTKKWTVSGTAPLLQEGLRMIKYAFRRPSFPIIIELDGYVISARLRQSLEKKISGIALTPGRAYDGVDVTGDNWVLYAESMILSPLTLRKRQSKLELIKRVNGRMNKNPEEKPYSVKSLSAKTFERVFEDLVDILTASPVPRQ